MQKENEKKFGLLEMRAVPILCNFKRNGNCAVRCTHYIVNSCQNGSLCGVSEIRFDLPWNGIVCYQVLFDFDGTGAYAFNAQTTWKLVHWKLEHLKLFI